MNYYHKYLDVITRKYNLKAEQTTLLTSKIVWLNIKPCYNNN